MAFAITLSIPIVALFVAAQRWFIAGLTAGAVKD
jgi:ABC-type maltose transport system permease subunit